MREIIRNFELLSLDEKNRRNLAVSSWLVKQLQDELETVNADRLVVGVYAPLVGEPVWWQNDAVKRFPVDWAFPVARREESDVREMDFYLCKEEELVPQSSFGIKLRVPPQQISPVIPDCFLIPGMAFDQSGNRLGKGKGWYDYYLKNIRGKKIGVCFQEQLVNEVPVNDDDIQMDVVITDSGVFNASKS